MRFSSQEYWSVLPCPSPGDLPDSGIKPKSPAPKVIGSSSNFAGCCCYGLTRPCALHRVPFAPDAGDKGRREQAGVVHQPWHLTGASNLEEASYKVEASYRVEASYQVGTSYQQRLVIR